MLLSAWNKAYWLHRPRTVAQVVQRGLHVEVPDGTRQVLAINFNGEHEIVIGGCSDSGEGGVGVGLDILSVGDGGESECVYDHAGKADDDGHDDGEW